MGKHKGVVVNRIPPCSICQSIGAETPELAYVDGKTKYGPWAYMCYWHFQMAGVGLGLGKGQVLIEKPS